MTERREFDSLGMAVALPNSCCDIDSLGMAVAFSIRGCDSTRAIVQSVN